MVRAVANKTVTAKPTTTMSKILSSFLSPSGDLYWWLQIASLCLIGLSVAVGGFTIATGWKINRRQAREIEDLKIKRVELEKSVAWRGITITGGNEAPLREFSGTEAIIWYMPEDTEARRAAGQLHFALNFVGWKVVEVRPDASADSIPMGGVAIEVYFPPMRTDSKPSRRAEELNRASKRSEIAANTLAEFLANVQNGWESVSTWPSAETPLEQNQLRIKIGSKPMPYFDAALPGLKPIKERREEEHQRRLENIDRCRKYLEEGRKSDEINRKLREKGIIGPEEE
jgi:hypothetical protein